MRPAHAWLLAGLLACQRTPEPELAPHAPTPPLVREEALAEPAAPSPTQPPGVALPDAPTDFFDFSDGRPRSGDFLVWHRVDDYQPDVTYWLAIDATSTELVGQRDGLWIAQREAIWHWLPTQQDLRICAPLACEEEVPHCKPMAKTGLGTIDEALWRDLLTEREVPVGPRLPSMAATGLGARSLHESWLPLAVLDGTLVLRVETFWRQCEGGGGGRVQVKEIAPPLPTMRPVLTATVALPGELRVVAPDGRAIWGGLHQAIDGDGRWHFHDEWLVPLPAEISEVAMESLYTMTRTPAERLPPGLLGSARESPSLRTAALAKGASEEDSARWGWSRLRATGERREVLRSVFCGDAPAPGPK